MTMAILAHISYHWRVWSVMWRSFEFWNRSYILQSRYPE